MNQINQNSKNPVSEMNQMNQIDPYHTAAIAIWKRGYGGSFR